MKTQLSLALLALALSGSTALAVPTLKGEITVNKAIVTVGDMFDDAGALAETGIFMAPAPGTTGVVPLADVERAAALVGLEAFENVGFTRVRVARASTLVDAAMLDTLIDADLTRRGILNPHARCAVLRDLTRALFPHNFGRGLRLLSERRVDGLTITIFLGCETGCR